MKVTLEELKQAKLEKNFILYGMLKRIYDKQQGKVFKCNIGPRRLIKKGLI